MLHTHCHIFDEYPWLTSSVHSLATCFFLGILFALFPYDFPLLWDKKPLPEGYLDKYEDHLKFMHEAPPLISRMLHIALAIVFLGILIKLWRPSEANFLFDGASMILYLIAFAVYTSNTIKGLRSISDGIWRTDEWQQSREGRFDGEVVLGREDSLKVLAASNTILALVLAGVLVLQAGQWYAERTERKELDAPADEKDKKGDTETKATKKKQ